MFDLRSNKMYKKHSLFMFFFISMYPVSPGFLSANESSLVIKIHNLVPRVLSLPPSRVPCLRLVTCLLDFADSRDVIERKGWKVKVCPSTELAY